jgi:XTP/dITP diphosphohydrolase
MKLVFATNNLHKVEEISALLGGRFKLQTLTEIGSTEDIPETQATIEGNAIQKANYVFSNYKVNCFADDTGLEIEALDGEPGVLSARYAGEERNNEKNNDLVLKKLQNSKNRNAQFKTVIALNMDSKLHVFEGIIKGVILTERRGSNGFGYDSIFVANGQQKSFAELSSDEKNQISHRAIAFKKLIEHLKNYSA